MVLLQQIDDHTKAKLTDCFVEHYLGGREGNRRQYEAKVADELTRLGEGGIEILNLVISKPSIPSDIAHNYKQVA